MCVYLLNLLSYEASSDVATHVIVFIGKFLLVRWLGDGCSGYGVGLDSRPIHFWVAFHPSTVGKSSTSLLAGIKSGCVHLCQVAGNAV